MSGWSGVPTLAPVPRAVDVVAAVALCAAAIGGTVVAGAAQHPSGPLGPAGCLLILLAAAAWSWRRGAPAWSMAVVTAVTAVYVIAEFPYGPIQLFVVMASYGVARRRSVRTALITCTGATIVLATALWTRLDNPFHLAVTAAVLIAWPGVFVVVPALSGALARMRASASRRERRVLVARAAFEERLRIAREVHDTAGHGFAVVAMQAGVALTVFDEQPEQARVSLEAIRATSEQALRELHATLETFHDRDDRQDAGGAGNLAALVDRVRAGGLAVEVTVDGAADGLAAPAATAVYRVVQESLTNVVRHAGTSAASVGVTVRPDEVTVVVSDRGSGSAGAAAGRSGGRGLAGIRERVARLGGVLTASDRPDGGFEVRARIPVVGGPR